MSQLVKTKRQANFKDFKRFGAFKTACRCSNSMHYVDLLMIYYLLILFSIVFLEDDFDLRYFIVHLIFETVVA
jgi:hypothetical protein